MSSDTQQIQPAVEQLQMDTIVHEQEQESQKDTTGTIKTGPGIVDDEQQGHPEPNSNDTATIRDDTKTVIEREQERPKPGQKVGTPFQDESAIVDGDDKSWFPQACVEAIDDHHSAILAKTSTGHHGSHAMKAVFVRSDRLWANGTVRFFFHRHIDEKMVDGERT